MAFKCPRWTAANVLPVAFVLWVISTIWGIHLCLHLLPLLTAGDDATRWQGVVEATISQTLTLLLAICFGRAVWTDPGSVPNRPEWQPEDVVRKSFSFQKSGRAASDAADKLAPLVNEVKQTGERRFCKWCDNYKPDRCHHCRVCKSCILRMDHHCPWIANCVGFRNHKYFLLLVFYALLNLMFVIMTMAETLWRSIHEEMTFTTRFLIVFGMTLAIIMSILLTLFFGFHVGLMARATTTIEHCEKQYKVTSTKPPSYDLGVYANLQATLGPQPLLWLLPFSPPLGNGLTFSAAPRGSQHGTGAETTALLAPHAAQPGAEGPAVTKTLSA